MKLKDIISFLTFSNFADEKKIELQFSIQHNNYQSIHSYWSINATKRKLITEFWYNTVIKHYLLICSIALFGLSIFKNKYLNDPIELIFAPISISFVFIPVAMFVYFPSFYNNYLPLLENCAESFTGKQLEGIQKCKREQYSVMSLMLIQHILQQLAGIHNLSVSEQHTNILMKQYGVSQKMIDTTLRTIHLKNYSKKCFYNLLKKVNLQEPAFQIMLTGKLLEALKYTCYSFALFLSILIFFSFPSLCIFTV